MTMVCQSCPVLPFQNQRKYYIVVFLIFSLLRGTLCMEDMTVKFNRTLLGVEFSAYVHQNVTRSTVFQDWTSYSLKDMKTMMEVISTKFSKIATFSVGVRPDLKNYKENDTYYQSFSQVLSAEAAAGVNVEMEKKRDWSPIEMYVGIIVHNNADIFQVELKLAKESVTKANALFPKTVTALVFNNLNIPQNETLANYTLEGIKMLKDVSKQTGLRVGTRQSCRGLNSTKQTKLVQIRKEIITMSDFVICPLNLNSNNSKSFEDFISNRYNIYKDLAQNLNPEVEVMLQTGISANSLEIFEVERLKRHWEMVNEWAEKEGVMVWMHEAIDNPWKNGTEGQLGWWKLTSNEKTGVVGGYVEKWNNKQVTPIDGEESKACGERYVVSINPIMFSLWILFWRTLTA